jgi:hypothetical protein
MKRQAVELIEDKLIVDERRISLPEVLLLSQGYPKELLDYLLNTTRLIRVDNERYVEISHDRLLSSILKSRKQRVKEEERLQQLEHLRKVEAEKEERDREWRKEKRIKRRFFRLTLVLGVLLVGLAITFLRMMRSDATARIATLNYLLSQQAYDEADSTLGKQRFSFLFNFYHRDSLQVLEDSVKREKKLQDQFVRWSTRGDTALFAGSPLLTVADALILKADSLAEEKQATNRAPFDSVGTQLRQTLGADELIQARKYYFNARETGYTPVAVERRAETILAGIDEKIAHSFKQCIDAAYVFLKANDRQAAGEALKKGQQIYALTGDSTRPIGLNPEDISYLDSLKKILQQ